MFVVPLHAIFVELSHLPWDHIISSQAFHWSTSPLPPKPQKKSLNAPPPSKKKPQIDYIRISQWTPCLSFIYIYFLSLISSEVTFFFICMYISRSKLLHIFQLYFLFLYFPYISFILFLISMAAFWVYWELYQSTQQ